ncbi:MAG: hypothetical protein AAGI09_11775 [Pseudomonadota bacterium]
MDPPSGKSFFLRIPDRRIEQLFRLNGMVLSGGIESKEFAGTREDRDCVSTYHFYIEVNDFDDPPQLGLGEMQVILDKLKERNTITCRDHIASYDLGIAENVLRRVGSMSTNLHFQVVKADQRYGYPLIEIAEGSSRQEISFMNLRLRVRVTWDEVSGKSIHLVDHLTVTPHGVGTGGGFATMNGIIDFSDQRYYGAMTGIDSFENIRRALEIIELNKGRQMLFESLSSQKFGPVLFVDDRIRDYEIQKYSNCFRALDRLWAMSRMFTKLGANDVLHSFFQNSADYVKNHNIDMHEEFSAYTGVSDRLWFLRDQNFIKIRNIFGGIISGITIPKDKTQEEALMALSEGGTRLSDLSDASYEEGFDYVEKYLLDEFSNPRNREKDLPVFLMRQSHSLLKVRYDGGDAINLGKCVREIGHNPLYLSLFKDMRASTQ